MAEEVQRVLDEMVPALKDLQERGVFSPEEIHHIVDRRRDAEYAIRRRRNVQKADFLQYIQDEILLEQLRVVRVRQLKRAKAALAEDADEDDEGKDRKRADAKSIGNAHIQQHITYLWGKLLRHFKSDLSLHLKYVEYLKEVRWHRTLSRILAQALQLFPHETGLWIEAASHEYFQVGSVANARVLLQRGLRLTPKSSDLWIQLFALELHFVEKLRARRKVLTRARETDNNNEAPNEEQPDETEMEELHQIARIVYKNATAAIPNDVTFRLRFWDQCRLFTGTDDLRRMIVRSLRDECKDKPEAWMAWALFQWEKKSSSSAPVMKGGIDDPTSAGFTRSADNSVGTPGVEDDNDQEEEVEEKDRDGNEGMDEVKEGVDEGKKLSSGGTLEMEKDKENEENEENAEKNDRNEGTHGSKKRTAEDDEICGEQMGDDDDVGQPDRKKQRTDAADDNITVLQILRQATKQLPTEEMYLKAVRMISRYVASMEELKEEEEASSGIELLEILFDEVHELDLVSSDVVLEQTLFLTRLSKTEEAAKCLKSFVTKEPRKAGVKLWLHMAEMSDAEPFKVLQNALKMTDANDRSHYELLLHLFGARLQGDKDGDLFPLFQKILLMTPGFLPVQEIEEPVFGIRHALDVCHEYLKYLRGTKNLRKFRRVYHALLYESSMASVFSVYDDEGTKEFIDEAIEGERAEKQKTVRMNNLRRLYDEAFKLFENSSLGTHYRQRKMEELLTGGSKPASKAPEVPSQKASPKFDETYRKYQIVHLTQCKKKEKSILLDDLLGIFTGLAREDKETWCVETVGEEGTSFDPSKFLSPSSKHDRGYCSFLVQKDTSAYEDLVARLPVDVLPGAEHWDYSSKALWIFFGRNPPPNEDLDGRDEHTDSVSNDGTWHFQLSGCKSWYVRPTAKLLDHLRKCLEEREFLKWVNCEPVRIDCNEGDVLVINTRFWFHCTKIPPQQNPSVSYARDFFEYKQNCVNALDSQNDGMKNIDGLYATNDIEEGTIIFREDDMPDCELHRSSNPNCEVTKLDSGTHAVISSRAIMAGEFFCIAESSDEEEDAEFVDEVK